MVAIAAEAGHARAEPANRVPRGSTFETLNAMWILQSERAIWASRLL